MSKSPAAPPRKSQRRRDQRPPDVKRSPDYPVDVEGGRKYLLKGVPPDLWQRFDDATKRAGRSWRWTLFTLMDRYARGAVTIPEETI